MNKKIMLSIIFLILSISIMMYISSLPTETKSVDCYDNKNNVIVGSECISENIISSPFILIITIVSIISLFLFFYFIITGVLEV